MKTAQIEISAELLREVLCLPENVGVSAVLHKPEFNTYSVVLYGDGLPDACSKDGEPSRLVPYYWRDNEHR